MTPRDFRDLRVEFDCPPPADSGRFPAEVETEAQVIAERPDTLERVDLTDQPFVTIDPPGSMDLDQALLLERRGDVIRVRYAIADLGATVPPGGPLDREVRRRGQTLYLPDGRIPLHPAVLSEGALSLLPDQIRPAVVWTIDVDPAGACTTVGVERARVRSAARLDYAGVQRDVDAGHPHPSVEALGDLGRRRRAARLAAGALDLALPTQEVVPAQDAAGWTIRLEPRVEVDAWNAEVSLLTGMAAAQIMLDHGVGLLRTLPKPADEDLDGFMSVARCLGIATLDGALPGQILAGLDPPRPASLALMTHATRLLRGAAYTVVTPELATADSIHTGIGGPYAHVTAPLRRLSDRFSTEICLALVAGQPAPGWASGALAEVAETMRATDRRAADLDRAAVDLVETWVMTDAGEAEFDAVVLRSREPGSAEVLVIDRAVVAICRGPGLVDGKVVRVRVDEIDASARRVTYRSLTP